MIPGDEEAPPAPVLEGCPSDPAALLIELGIRLRPDDIGIIAMADRGEDHELHRKALLSIAETGTVPCPLPWEPREVVNLYRWGDAESGQGEALRQWHARRAFCCVVTLVALGQDREDLDTDRADTCLGFLALDVAALEPPPHREALSLLTWLLGRLPRIEMRTPAHLGAALLWHGLQVRPRMPGADLVALAMWTMAAEDHQSRRHRWCMGLEPGESWLIGTSENLRSARAWTDVLARMARLPVPGDAPQVGEWTRLWAAMAPAVPR